MIWSSKGATAARMAEEGSLSQDHQDIGWIEVGAVAAELAGRWARDREDDATQPELLAEPGSAAREGKEAGPKPDQSWEECPPGTSAGEAPAKLGAALIAPPDPGADRRPP